MRFTRARDELLIELVKGHRILFDTSDENFKNNILKHKSWEEISAVVGFPVPECKKRWKSLRDQYNKKKRGDLASGERTSSTWEYMNLMTFLSDTVSVAQRENPTNCDNSVQQIVVELAEEANTDDEEQRDERNEEKSQQSIMDEVSKEDPLNTEESADAQNKRRFAKRKLEPITKIMARRRQRTAMYEKMINKIPEIKTPTQKFFESMADIVDKLPNHLQAEVRLKVCETVTEAELKHHTQNAILYPNLSSQAFSQFSNIVEFPTQSTEHVSNTEYLDSSIPSSKLKEDLD